MGSDWGWKTGVLGIETRSGLGFGLGLQVSPGYNMGCSDLPPHLGPSASEKGLLNFVEMGKRVGQEHQKGKWGPNEQKTPKVL